MFYSKRKQKEYYAKEMLTAFDIILSRQLIPSMHGVKLRERLTVDWSSFKRAVEDYFDPIWNKRQRDRLPHTIFLCSLREMVDISRERVSYAEMLSRTSLFSNDKTILEHTQNTNSLSAWLILAYRSQDENILRKAAMVSPIVLTTVLNNKQCPKNAHTMFVLSNYRPYVLTIEYEPKSAWHVVSYCC